MATKLDDIISKVKKKAAETSRDRPIKPPEGKSVWRILPGWNKDEPAVFFHAFGQHYIKGTDGKIKVVIGCVDRTYEKSCDICDMIAEAIKSAPDDATRDAIKDMRAQQVYLVNAVRVDGKEGERETPVIMAMPKTLFEGALMDALQEYGEEMLDLDEGNDVVITREGKGFDTRYSLVVRSQKKSTPVAESVWQKCIDLAAYVDEDFESKKQKAIDAIGEHMGTLPSLTSEYGGPGLKGESLPPADRAPDPEIEDADIVDDGPDADEQPSDDEKEEAETTFEDEISDEELDRMLNDGL